MTPTTQVFPSFNSVRVQFNPIRLLCLVLAAAVSTASVPAAPKYWVGTSGTTNVPTSGTWQTTTPTVWSDGTVDTANAGWTAGDTAFFGGADGAYGIQAVG